MHTFSNYRLHWVAVSVAIGMMLSAGFVGAEKKNEDKEGRGPDSYTVGLFGDMP